MILNRTNIILSGSLVLLVLLIGGTRTDYSQPNIEILPDMKYSPAWTAYAKNSVFANGRTLQAPVHGTIALGDLPLHFKATEADAIRAGEELMNPYHADSIGDPTVLQESIRRGADSFRVFCIVCHGATGLGDGPVPKRGFPPPPSLLTGKSPQMKDGQIFHILTYGQGSMSGFSGQLSPETRWDLINYVRSMQGKADKSNKPDTPDVKNSTSDVNTDGQPSDPSAAESRVLQEQTSNP